MTHSGSAGSTEFQNGAESTSINYFSLAPEKLVALAETGDVFAMKTLGLIYQFGRGDIRRDEKKAFEWFTRAAEQGDASARGLLGYLYEHGVGVTQDYPAAIKWYKLAAEDGDVSAQFYLGDVYSSGQGVAQDFVQAHMWYNIAAANGNYVAAGSRDLVAKNMTSAEIEEAQKLAREWVASHGKSP